MSSDHVIVASTTDNNNDAARALAAAALAEHIKANHSYDVSEIIATPITGGSADPPP